MISSIVCLQHGNKKIQKVRHGFLIQGHKMSESAGRIHCISEFILVAKSKWGCLKMGYTPNEIAI